MTATPGNSQASDLGAGRFASKTLDSNLCDSAHCRNNELQVDLA